MRALDAQRMPSPYCFAPKLANASRLVGHMDPGVARAQANDLMQMLDRTLGFTYCSFQSAENCQHERIVGVHLMSMAGIGKRIRIAIQLFGLHDA